MKLCFTDVCTSQCSVSVLTKSEVFTAVKTREPWSVGLCCRVVLYQKRDYRRLGGLCRLHIQSIMMLIFVISTKIDPYCMNVSRPQNFHVSAMLFLCF